MTSTGLQTALPSFWTKYTYFILAGVAAVLLVVLLVHIGSGASAPSNRTEVPEGVNHSLSWSTAAVEGLIGVLAALVVLLIDRGIAIHHTKDVLKQALNEVLPIHEQARKRGLIAVYPSDNAAVTDVQGAVRNAHQFVYILAHVGNRPIDIRPLLAELTRKKLAEPSLNVRLLLSHPYRSPHMLRAAVSKDSEKIENLLRAARESRRRDGTPDALIDEIVREWRQFTQPKSINNDFGGDGIYSPLRDCLRYFATDSQMWMVLTEHQCFVKTMTFSIATSPGSDPDQSFARQVPMLQFDGLLAPDVLKAYERHIDVLWQISTDDWHWMRARVTEEKRLLRRVLAKRGPWLEHAFPDCKRSYKRMHYRYVYKAEEKPTIRLRAKGVLTTEAECRVLDASPFGLGIEMTAVPSDWTEGAILLFPNSRNTNPDEEGGHIEAAGAALCIHELKVKAIKRPNSSDGSVRLCLCTDLEEQYELRHLK